MRYELRCYELGNHEIPPPEIAIFSPGADMLIRPPRAIEIAILGTRDDGDEDLREIKPPVHIPGGIPLWLLAIALASLLVAAAAVVSRVVNRRGPAGHPLPPPPPMDFAAEFARIAAMGLLERGAFKIYYTLLSETLRHFLEEKADVEALERTTGEIAASVDGLAIDPALARDVIEFLSEADLVKFARASPGIEQARKAPGAGRPAALDQ